MCHHRVALGENGMILNLYLNCPKKVLLEKEVCNFTEVRRLTFALDSGPSILVASERAGSINGEHSTRELLCLCILRACMLRATFAEVFTSSEGLG